MSAALAVLLVAGLAAAPAQAGRPGPGSVQNPRAPWRVIESGRFRVCFRGGLDTLASRVLDLARDTDAVLARRLGGRSRRRVPIVLCESRNELAPADGIPEPLSAGAEGFEAAFRHRVVVPLTAPHEELRSVVVRGLARDLIDDMLGGGPASRLLVRHSGFATPAWFIDGLAEYLSSGVRPEASMFLRDGVIAGTLPPLDRSGGERVPGQGRSAVGFLVDRYGEERLRELLRRMRASPGFGRAFRRVMGLPVRSFEEQWREWLRREYWPAAATRSDPERFARRLTDHRRDGGSLNTAPAISPQGDRVAWFCERGRSAEVHVMSAYDGKARRCIVRGRRGSRFGAIPPLRDAIAWSPDGLRLAFAGGSGRRDALYVVSSADGRVVRRIELDCDALACPAWSPVAESLVVVGWKAGRSDLWLVDIGTGGARRLTENAWDEDEPCWTPDGRTVTFVSDRPVPLQPEGAPQPAGHVLHDLDLASGAIVRRAVTTGDERSPAWSPDGRKLAFVAERGGVCDLVLFDVDTRSSTQLTDVLGGVSSLSWSRRDDRLVFSAFSRGGYDVFALKEPVSVDAVLDRFRRLTPQAALSGAGTSPAVADREAAPVIEAGAALVEQAGPAAPPDPAVARTPGPRLTRLSADRVRGDVLSAEGLGVVGRASVVFADLVGERRLTLAADVGRGPPERTNALLSYAYRPRRWDLGVGLFRLGDPERALASSTMGGTMGLPGPGTIFAEASVGAWFGASRPFDRFRRLDLVFTQQFAEGARVSGGAREAARSAEHRRGAVSAPSISLAGDDVLWGSTGPLNGWRSSLTLSPSFEWRARKITGRTVTLDIRRYWGLPGGYTLAARALAGRSDGSDARTFFLGGVPTLRGFPYDGIERSRLAVVNGELRFPFIERLGMVGPLPIGRLDLRGALFADAGIAWDGGEPLCFTRVVKGRRRLASPLASFGGGVRRRVGFVILKLDVVWRTDLASTGRPRWEFNIGPEF